MERINRSLGPISKLRELENGKYWDSVIEEVEYTLNNTQHCSTKILPSEMLFGLAQKGKVSDELEAKLEMMNELDNSTERNLEHIREIGEKNQVLAQANNEKAFNEKKKIAIKYSVGDYVMVKKKINT